MIRFLSKAGPEQLRGTAVLRLDLNVEDTWRLEAALPTLRLLVRRAERTVIISHKGRPEGQDPKYSLRSSARTISRFLKRPVRFLPELELAKARKIIASSPKGSVFLLENVRFHAGEAANDPALAKELAALGDYYVNDAFAVSHRANASLVAITKFLPAYAGLLMEKEIGSLQKIMRSPRRPLVVLVGGAKAKDKLEVLRRFKGKTDAFLLGGGPANTLLALQGVDIGVSVADKDPADLKFLKVFSKSKKVYLPEDWKSEGGRILDIGPRAAEAYQKQIARAGTILWSGPMGRFEKKKFAAGNLAVARAIVRNRRAFSVTGGGETVTFLRKNKLDRGFSFISTGGGAMLEFLAGKKLPGITALNKR